MLILLSMLILRVYIATSLAKNNELSVSELSVGVAMT